MQRRQRHAYEPAPPDQAAPAPGFAKNTMSSIEDLLLEKLQWTMEMYYHCINFLSIVLWVGGARSADLAY